jgi:hypothetical protein
MATDLSFINNPIQAYAYEGFNYTISNPLDPTYTLQTVSNTSGFGVSPSPLYFTKNGNTSYTFSVSDASMNLTANTTESFVLRIVDPSGNTFTSSNSVNTARGRFLGGSGNSLNNNSYTFYKNEAITPIRLVAPSFTLLPPTSIPTLPPGLSFVSNASNIYDITGVPLVTVPNSNYQIIGLNTARTKTITTNINIAISNERLRLDLSGASIVNNMEVDTAIDPIVITAIPSVGTSTVRYSFSSFPDGLVVRDKFGSLQSSPFFIQSNVDPSYTFVLSGAPTIEAAYALKNIIGGTASATVQGARVVPTPVVESSQDFSFRFGPTILFDRIVVPTLYTSNVFDPSAISFYAKTYFTSNVPITSIFSPDLRSDLSLSFDVCGSRAYLVGNPFPSIAGSADYTIRAIDADTNTRDYSATITVIDDVVSFSSPVSDTCVNYILSRPTSNFKPGYYESNIRFSASALSARPVNLSAPGLTGTGLSLDSNGIITGIPTTVVPLTDLIVTATVSGSTESATKTIKFAILNDTFEFTDVSASSLNFIQNVAITPFRFPVTTLSDRSIVNYSQIGFPTGLTINPAGTVSGTPTSSAPTAGNVTITATTGYASGSRDFSYNLIPDSMIFVVPQTSYSYQAGNSIGNIDINGVTFSGTTVSNYDLSISPTYGMTLNSSNGILSGTWTTGIPPEQLLPASCNFAVTAQAGSLTGTLPMTFTANPVVTNASLFVAYGNIPTSPSSFQGWMYYNTPTDISSFVHVVDTSTSQPFMDLQFKNNDPTNNTIVATTIGSPGYIFKGTRLNDLSAIAVGGADFVPQISSLAFGSGTTLYGA